MCVWECVSSLSPDFFRGHELKKLALDGVDHVISFTAADDRVYFRVFQ